MYNHGIGSEVVEVEVVKIWRTPSQQREHDAWLATWAKSTSKLCEICVAVEIDGMIEQDCIHDGTYKRVKA